MERMKRNYYLDDNTDTYCLTEKWELKTRLTTFPLGNVHGVIVRAVRRDKNTPQRLGKRRKEKEAKKKIENKDKKGQKGSVFADLCRFICINKKKIVILRAFCDIAKLHMNS